MPKAVAYNPVALLLAATMTVMALADVGLSSQTRQATWTEAYNAYSSGDFRRAEALFREMVEDYPTWGYARYMLGMTLQRLGMSDEALGELRLGARRVADPESQLLIQRAVAEIRLQRGEHDEAIEAAQTAERLLSTLERRQPVTGRDAPSAFGGITGQRVAVTEILGRGHLLRQEWSEATRHLERLTELRPADPEAFSLLGQARYRLDAPARALAAFERTLELDPGNVEALRYSSRIHLEQGRYVEAVETARRGIRERPGDGELLELLGRAALELGRYREAVDALEAAARQRPLGGELLCRLGDAHLQVDEPERAAERFRAARDLLEPGDEMLPDCLGGLATAYEEAGRLRDALEVHEELLLIRPSAQTAAAVARLRRSVEEAGPGGGRGGVAPGEPVEAGEADVGNVVRTFRGTGTRSTRPFDVVGRWEIRWTSGQGIRILLFSASGEEIGVAAEQPTAGPGSSFQPEGGSFFLRIEASGAWEIQVVELDGR